MPEPPAVLIAAVSGRALAQSACRGGYLPLVADFFGDQDTLQAACAHARIGGHFAHGFAETPLLRALDALGRARAPLGLVCGGGFEDRSALLSRLAGRWRLFGNTASTVAMLKDPIRLAALCRDAAIPFPDTAVRAPAACEGWLEKRIGGAGGSHVRPASRRPADGRYYQRKMPGEAVSALFLAAGGQARVIGFSTQWPAPAAGKPYRYGGAVRPAPLAPALQAALTGAVAALAGAAALAGLNSADFLVDGDRYWLLEVNPRPGGTLDIFEPPRGSLFALHLAACAGCLAASLADGCAAGKDDNAKASHAKASHAKGSNAKGSNPKASDAKASVIVYAEEDIPSFPVLDWPDWAADRPCPGSTIGAGEPLCTVYACGPTAGAARDAAEERGRAVLAFTRTRRR